MSMAPRFPLATLELSSEFRTVPSVAVNVVAVESPMKSVLPEVVAMLFTVT